MSQQFWISVGTRFGKAFLAGGVASLVLALSNAPQFNTLSDVKVWGAGLAIAFMSGGLLALEKAFNWTP